jgi:6-phosphogluconolactonase
MKRLAAALVALCATLSFAADVPKAYHVFIGTYTGKQPTDSKGIYCFKLDMGSGKLTPVGLAAEIESPSFLAIHPSGKFLYSVGEINNFNGKKGGAVSAFSIGDDGKLTLLNQETSGGPGPCFVSVDKTGQCVLVANYGGGSIEAIGLEADGKLKSPGTFIQHEGSSVNPSRQKEPHAHSINVSPDNRFAFAADLGLDKILIYKLDPAAAKLEPNDPPFAKTPAGGGPRHFAFHPNGKFAYSNNEILSSVTAYEYSAEKGALADIQTISTLPGEVKGNSTAEVQVHPSGKFLYCSNRGHDSIACFSIDQATGKLTSLGQKPSGGKTPRNFGIDPTGSYLIAAHQSTGNLVVFKIDPKSGELTQVGEPLDCKGAVCVKFVAAKQ